MHARSFSHFDDRDLLRQLASLTIHERTATAELIACIAEVDARRLYVPAGYPSMHAYCVNELRLSEDAALKRIRAARAARQFPILFDAMADGRLSLSAVVLLKPYLTPENVDPLMAVAAHKTRSEIEVLLAQRFPRSEVLAMVQAIPGSPPLRDEQLVPEPVGECRAPVGATDQLAPGPVGATAPHAKVTPIAVQRFELRVSIGQSAYDKLRHAQELLSHQIPSSDLAAVLERALDALIPQLEKRKFAATSRPRKTPGRSSAGGRYVPAHVRRAVRKRDGGQCTFVSETGHRCSERTLLEFDHIVPVARGGQATVENMRLRCRAHNQHEAERTFGAGFMENKRQEARRAAKARRAAAEARAAEARVAAQAHARAEATEQTRDVMAGLRELGFRADQARRAVEYSESLHDATLEERVRAALKSLCPRPRFQGRVGTSVGASP